MIALENLSSFLGYGDKSSAKLWFAGIEEASSYKSIEDLRNTPKKELVTFNGCKDEKTSVYIIISKIVLGLVNDEWKESWQQYRDNKLFSLKSEAAQINIYPLGKQNVQDWPDFYSEYFKLTREQYYKFIEEDKNGRFEKIYNFRTENGNPLTICFGKQFWDSFEKCFRLINHSFYTFENIFRFYYDDNIIFTTFFRNNSMSNKRIEILLSKIREYKINPFTKWT